MEARQQGFDGKKVLVVDDYLENREILQYIMKEVGCEVEVAENGKQALDLYDQNTFDLVFTDVNMPEMNGYELSKEIRQREKESEKHTLIIALTANLGEDDKTQGHEAGMDDFIGKPITASKISDILKKHLSS